jgi:SAM-dependent methyltransferase
MNKYRRRVWDLFQPLLDEVGPAARVLDFGSGDGWFADQFQKTGRAKDLLPVDVFRRKEPIIEPMLYDGNRLPFPDRSFDLTYSVDVLHHCPDPTASLRDLLRVTGRWFLLKDHTWKNRLGKMVLAVLDEIGNRRFGVRCLYRHQREWEWSETLKAEGFEMARLVHPARCHVGGMAWVNRFEFVSLWHRVGER